MPPRHVNAFGDRYECQKSRPIQGQQVSDGYSRCVGRGHNSLRRSSSSGVGARLSPKPSPGVTGLARSAVTSSTTLPSESVMQMRPGLPRIALLGGPVRSFTSLPDRPPDCGGMSGRGVMSELACGPGAQTACAPSPGVSSASSSGPVLSRTIRAGIATIAIAVPSAKGRPAAGRNTARSRSFSPCCRAPPEGPFPEHCSGTG